MPPSLPAAPPVRLVPFVCPHCGSTTELWEGVIYRLDEAKKAAASIAEFGVEVDSRSECDRCCVDWMRDMGLAESDDLEAWQRELGMVSYRMREEHNDLRSSREDYLRKRGFYLTLVVSHASLVQPERVFVDSNNAVTLLRLLGGQGDRQIAEKEEFGVEPDEIEAWYLRLRQRVDQG